MLSELAKATLEAHRRTIADAVAAERERCAKLADGVAEFWRKHAKEWESPKHDHNAEFVRRAAKHRSEAADQCAKVIRA